jgi:tRNA(fMet)-specific endonuclease VapC
VKKYLLDSGILSDLINRRRNVFERLTQEAAAGVRVGTCIPVLAEICFGIEASASRDRNMQRLRSVLPSLTLWPLDADAAFTYGEIASQLRSMGRPMQQVDMMVAAIAKNLTNCVVLTTDSDLDAIPGLRVERW